MARSVIGLFDDFAQAQQVVQELADAGFRREDISLIRGNAKGDFTQTTASDTGAGAAAGAGTGAVLGGIAGLLVGLGALAIPGVGPIIAAGPLAAALTGAGIGAAAGGLIGALTSLGVPEDQAQLYAEGIRQGGTLVAVTSPDNMLDRAVDIMNRNGAIDIERRRTGTAAAPAQTMSTQTTSTQTTTTPAPRQTSTTQQSMTQPAQLNEQGEMRIPVIEEQVQVSKQPVISGGVRVYTTVEQKPVEENVTLRQENVNVERRPVDRPATDADFNALKEGTLEVTERAEQPVVNKTARVVEEVVVNKTTQEQTVPVQETVRRTDVKVEELPAQQRTTQTVNTADTAFRNDFQTNYAKTGARYETYQPAYEYGTTLARDARYRSGDWNQYEPEFRRSWESEHPNNP